MKISYEELEKLEQAVDERYESDNEMFTLPSKEAVDRMLENIDKDDLAFLMFCLKVRPLNNEEKEIQKYIREEMYKPENVEVYDSENEPCTITFQQLSTINKVVKNMGDNVFSDEWFPSIEDIERCKEHMDLNTVKFLAYIGKSRAKSMTEKQKRVRALARQIICAPEYVTIKDDN